MIQAANIHDLAVVERLDSSERGRHWVVEHASGGYFRVSDSVARLLELHRSGLSAVEIAAALGIQGSDAEQTVRTALEGVLAKLNRNAGRQQHDRAFLFRIPLLRQRFVEQVAVRMSFLFRYATAVPLVLLAASLSAHTVWSSGIGSPSPPTLLLGSSIFLLCLLCHELGHAAACSAMGARPSDIGLTTYFIYPAFYSDVTSTWTLSRKRRVVVDLGGVYFQVLAMALCAIVSDLGGGQPFIVACWLNLASLLFSLNPILKMDGYWLLADALGVTNLSAQKSRVLGYFWLKLTGKKPQPLPWPNRIIAFLTVYSICGWLFLAWFASVIWPSMESFAIRLLVAGYELGSAVATGHHAGALSQLFDVTVAGLFVTFGVLISVRLATAALHRGRSIANRILKRTVP